MKQFRQELTRFRRWYSQKGLHQGGVKRPKVCNKKTQLHYKRLRKGIRMLGVWQSRSISLRLAAAKLSCQTGTVPTERCWSGLLPYFHMSVSHFTILNHMAFLRYIMRHLAKRATVPLQTGSMETYSLQRSSKTSGTASCGTATGTPSFHRIPCAISWQVYPDPANGRA